jgi:hypothetical protein
LLASLFRIEGAVFLLALPWLALADFSLAIRARIANFFALFWFVIIVGLLLLLCYLLRIDIALSKLTRVNELFDQLQHAMTIIGARFIERRQAIASHILPNVAASDAGLILFLTIIGWYLIRLINTLSLGYAFLVAVGIWLRKKYFTDKGRLVLYGYLLVGFSITLLFLAEHFFLSKRYLFALTLLLMLWVPFILDDLIGQYQQIQKRFILMISILLIAISAIGGLGSFGPSKFYVKKAGIWIRQNIPRQASVYSNSIQLMYYSEHFGFDIYKQYDAFKATPLLPNIKYYDYLAVQTTHGKNNELLPYIDSHQLTPLIRFANERGDNIFIYRVHHQLGG